ncbi:MAG: hypothetical protein BGO98_29165 [Myxococcales bacterium 68-20]|nr:SMP-30/gluconolactonase/LRE family protein [Myxococcales bacterium]OJY30837.1 MAG: hypothetical protein BGO98_29165 [Myxococcales bacterium 68-20]
MNKTLSAAIFSAGCMFVSVTASGHECSSLQVVASYTVGEVPESVTLDRSGNVYFSNGNTVRRRTHNGQESVFATLPIPVFALGVKVGPDGCVYNTSVSLDPSVQGAFVWRTCTAGSIAQPYATLDHAGGPNDLAFDDCGNLFVTDPFLGRVWKVTRQGHVSVWLSHSMLDGNAASPYLLFHSQGVNGIAFDEDKRNLYLGNLDYGKIIRVPIRWNGSAGTPSVWVSDPRLQGADGIAFDDSGDLYVAVNGQNSLVRVSRRGRIEVLFTGGLLDSPSSVAFGTRRGDRRTLYVASSAFMRSFGLQTGTPAPALLETRVKDEGLPLP